jgi:hypothetical protein
MHDIEPHGTINIAEFVEWLNHCLLHRKDCGRHFPNPPLEGQRSWREDNTEMGIIELLVRK